MNKPLIIILSILSIAVASCSNDDEPGMPDNAISLNMTIGGRQATIGGSDVYINSASNFTSSYCGIADLGRKGGFNRNPNLSQLAQEVAVMPGNYYQIVLSRDIKTVAGERAFPANTNFYNVYVDSWIYDKDNDISGAKVTYAECYPAVRQLPEWDSETDVKLTLGNGEFPETASYSFPKGCVIDSYVSTSNIGSVYDDLEATLDINVNGNTVAFSNSAWTPGGKVRVVLLVRYESVYSRVILNVESSI